MKSFQTMNGSGWLDFFLDFFLFSAGSAPSELLVFPVVGKLLFRRFGSDTFSSARRHISSYYKQTKKLQNETKNDFFSATCRPAFLVEVNLSRIWPKYISLTSYFLSTCFIKSFADNMSLNKSSIRAKVEKNFFPKISRLIREYIRLRYLVECRQ